MTDQPLEIEYVEFDGGNIPYIKWFRKQSVEVKSEIDARLVQVRKRNFGDHRKLPPEGSWNCALISARPCGFMEANGEGGSSCLSMGALNRPSRQTFKRQHGFGWRSPRAPAKRSKSTLAITVPI